MSIKVQRLYLGGGSFNSTTLPFTAYTAPAGKKVIIKSITIQSTSTTAERFTINLAGYAVAYNHTIKPYDTVVLPVAGFILNPGETLAYGTTIQGIAMSATGVVMDNAEPDTPFIVSRANALTTSNAAFQYRNTTNDVLIKSVNFCNVTATDTAVALAMGGFSIIGNHVLKAYDTLTIPFLDQLLVKGEYIQAWASTSGAAVYYCTGIVVNN